MSSPSRPTVNGDSVNESISNGPRNYHIGRNLRPPHAEDRPDPAWLPYTETVRGDVDVLFQRVYDHTQRINALHLGLIETTHVVQSHIHRLDGLHQGFAHHEQGLHALNQQLRHLNLGLNGQDEQLNAQNGLLQTQEDFNNMVQGNIEASNGELERTRQRVSNLEEHHQSMFHKFDKYDEYDTNFRNKIIKMVDEIKESACIDRDSTARILGLMDGLEERARVDRDKLEERMRLMEETMDLYKSKACKTKCKGGANEKEIRELGKRLGDVILDSWYKTQHTDTRMDRMERLLADQKCEILTLKQETRIVQEEMQEFRKELREEMEGLRAKCTPESSIVHVSRETSEDGDQLERS